MPLATTFLPLALMRTKTPQDTLVLTHEERTIRRRALTTLNGREILIDNEKPVTYLAGEGFQLEDGVIIEIIAAQEALLKVTSPNPLRLMEALWHIGNRHTPCMIEEATFYIEEDSVLAAMLRGRGLVVTQISHPFMPQRGAYHAH